MLFKDRRFRPCYSHIRLDFSQLRMKTNDVSAKVLFSRLQHVVANRDYTGGIRVGQGASKWFQVSGRSEKAEDSLGI